MIHRKPVIFIFILPFNIYSILILYKLLRIFLNYILNIFQGIKYFLK